MSKRSKSQESALEVLKGGTLPEKVVRRQLQELNKKNLADFQKQLALKQQAAKYFGQLQPSGGSNVAAIDGLRGITEKIQKMRPAAPRKLHVPPLPWAWGNYTLQFTPPYEGLGTYSVGEISSVVGNPTIAATGVDDLGQMTCTVEANYSSESSGAASNILGVYFKPMFPSATLTISFSSQLDFYWYYNAIQNKYANSTAQGQIKLYQYDGAFTNPMRIGTFLGWSEGSANGLDFHIVDEAGPTWSLEAPVSSEYFYFVVISLAVTANGTGWPGGLAGASATVTVPSITVNVQGEPIIVEA
jgi:hypothetical protein